MKKTFTTILFAMLAVATWAHDFEKDGIYYNITSSTDMTVEVTFEGSDYLSYKEYSGSLVIPSTVEYNESTYSVTCIGKKAIGGNSNLTSVTIPTSVTNIESMAFSSCSSLTSITIPNSITNIGKNAFSGCSGLTSVFIPNSVETIGYRPFHECYNLISITVSSENKKYDSRENCNAIINSSTNELIAGCINTVIPNTVKEIAEYTFSGYSNLVSLNIPNSVTTIGDHAFAWCTGLTSLNIPNSITELNQYAFYYCTGLTSLYIPSSVTSIGRNAFYDCTGLQSVYSYAEKPQTISSGTFYGGYNATLYVPYGSLTAYQTATEWKNFTKIKEMEPSGIEPVSANGNKTISSIFYNVNGIQSDKLQKGLNIIKTQDGVRKLLVK